jgi:nitroimidazol reductase NimA-like FMN-containing flavoprotein (pyridoxamine 5'-phosphate oxidase superfamily)
MMFVQMRRQDRALSQTETEAILSNGAYGILSLNGQDAHAYGVPLSYAFIDNRIYFHSAPEGEKLTRLGADNRVCFCVVGQVKTLPEKFSTEFASATLFGRAREVQGQEKLDALTALIAKYSHGFQEKGQEYIARAHHKTTVIRIDIEHMTGKARR